MNPVLVLSTKLYHNVAVSIFFFDFIGSTDDDFGLIFTAHAQKLVFVNF